MSFSISTTAGFVATTRSHNPLSSNTASIINYLRFPIRCTDLSRAEIQPSKESRLTISRARHVVASIIQNHDDRVLVIVGPCSIHSTEQAIVYANLLKSHLDRWDGLQIIMRTYL
jgi:phospho-2-dehydro-3-deoxyheptonate aldolase